MTYIKRSNEPGQIAVVIGGTFIEEWAFHLYSVWLFTRSDLKTILLPSTAFGLINGVALSLYNMHTNLSQRTLHIPLPYQILSNAPMVFLWIWMNLLPFAINNQRQPEAIQEDALNKPWRTMPSQRLSQKAAKNLMLVFYLIAIIISFYLGNILQCLALVLLGHWYNDLRGADANYFIRNFINACGFICFFSGALQVAIGGRGYEGRRSESAIQLLGWWYVVIACIVFSTVQTQDMYDQRGDAARNRRTIPLVIGDMQARWTIAIPMAVWCWATPWFWASSALAYIAPVLLGLTVTVRTLWARNEKQDKITFLIWNCWLASVYLLPLFKAVETHLSSDREVTV